MTTAQANRLGQTSDSRKVISRLIKQGMPIEYYWNIRKDDSGRTVLRSCYDAPDIDTCVYLEDNESVPVGTFLPVTVTGTMGMDLLGRPVNATDSEGTP